MRCVAGYEPNDENLTFFDDIKFVGFIFLVFPILFFAFIILWIIGGVER